MQQKYILKFFSQLSGTYEITYKATKYSTQNLMQYSHVPLFKFVISTRTPQINIIELIKLKIDRKRKKRTHRSTYL